MEDYVYKFESKEEYENWLETIVTKIYYGNISMNNDKIKEAVSEIAAKLWLSEIEKLYP